jgi:hypothetical protein
MPACDAVRILKRKSLDCPIPHNRLPATDTVDTQTANWLTGLCDARVASPVLGPTYYFDYHEGTNGISAELEGGHHNGEKMWLTVDRGSCHSRETSHPLHGRDPPASGCSRCSHSPPDAS